MGGVHSMAVLWEEPPSKLVLVMRSGQRLEVIRQWVAAVQGVERVERVQLIRPLSGALALRVSLEASVQGRVAIQQCLVRLAIACGRPQVKLVECAAGGTLRDCTTTKWYARAS